MSEEERIRRKRRLERDEIEALAAEGFKPQPPQVEIKYGRVVKEGRPIESRAEMRAREARARGSQAVAAASEETRLTARLARETRPELPPPPPLNFKVIMKCEDGTEPKSYVLYPVPGDTTKAQENYAKREALKAMTKIKKKCEVVNIESWPPERV